MNLLAETPPETLLTLMLSLVDVAGNEYAVSCRVTAAFAQDADAFAVFVGSLVVRAKPPEPPVAATCWLLEGPGQRLPRLVAKWRLDLLATPVALHLLDTSAPALANP